MLLVLAKIAKYLVSEFSTLTPPKGFYIKNSFELAEELSNMRIEEDEELVSFDVTALYPNIPITIALKILEEWLCDQDISDEKAVMFLKMARLCMNQTTFQFRGSFYRQSYGTCMGNPLSCFIANTFMATMEWSLKNKAQFPRYWRRYVDDVFVIIKKGEIQDLLNLLNSQFDSIKFTVEREENRRLPFLDLMLTRNNNRIDISVYRKPTSTDRYITYNSFTSYQHKLAAFNSMTYRLCKLPLNVQNYIQELKNIKRIALINGYKESKIDELVTKHSRKIKQESITTMKKIKDEPEIRRKFSFNGPLSYQISQILKRYNITCIFGNDGKLTNILGNTKDKIPDNQKSGIYTIKCNDCEQVYIGQSRRAIEIRYKEHRNHWLKGQPEKSSVAKHMIDEFHGFGTGNLKLLKSVPRNSYLDAFESLFIHKTKKTMNADEGPIISPLFKLTTKRYER